MSEEQQTCFVVHHKTGCTCCASDNYIEGPWRTREAAEAKAKIDHDRRHLASQWAPNGRHTVEEIPYMMAGDVIILRNFSAIMDGFIEDGDRHDYTIEYLPMH